MFLKLFCNLLKETLFFVPRVRQSISTRGCAVALELVRNEQNGISQFRGDTILEKK